MATTSQRWLAMPSGTSNDKPQQPKGSGFPGSGSLYPNKAIWTTGPYSSNHARVPSLTSKDEHGPSPLQTNTDGGLWNAYPWNDDSSRSTSTSPNRTRDSNGLPRTSTFGTNGAETHPSVGLGHNFNNFKKGYQDVHMPTTQKRSAGDASYLESLTSFPTTRDPSAPPSRQSQGSPAFHEAYNGRPHSHTHSSSLSQRQLPSQSLQFSHHAANNRAFNLNKQMDDDMSGHFSRRLTVDHTAPSTAFDPSSQSFQLNPGTQTFGDASGGRMPNGVDAQVDSLANQLSALKRPSIERASPAPTYRLESGSSPRGYIHPPPNPNPDLWATRPGSSRDPRTAEVERRGSAQSFAPSFNPSPYYSQQYPYSNVAPQFAGNYLDFYSQGLRHPMMPNYGLPPLPGNQVSLGQFAPIRPAADYDPTRGLRSSVLDDFKNNKHKRFELKDFYNFMVEFSGDQHGSRFIQQKLETANSDEKEQVFREIEPNAVQLMKDVFGNYVVQKFFEHGNQVQKKMLAEKIKPMMVDLSTQVYACRVVQKALEHVLVDQQLAMVKELEADALRVMTDQNGNHVIQKIIGSIKREHLDFIMTTLRGQVVTLSNHQYGCRVVQRMMDHGTREDNDAIVNELRPSAHLLLPDQYGNYVAQHIIIHGKPEDQDMMVRLVLDQIEDLCKHKFASNVVETCIIHGSRELRTTIRLRFEGNGKDGKPLLEQLMRDSYGNYVVQKMATWLDGDEQTAFVERIKPTFHELKRNGNSRQVAAMEKMLDSYGQGQLKPDPKHAASVSTKASSPRLPNGIVNSSPGMAASSKVTVETDEVSNGAAI